MAQALTLACAEASFLRKRAPARVPVPHKSGHSVFQHAPQMRDLDNVPFKRVVSHAQPEALLHPLGLALFCAELPAIATVLKEGCR